MKMSFEKFQLNPNINKAIVQSGYHTPTPIQVRTIPEVLRGKDVIAIAQTGTGKTAAFVLPILHQLKALPYSKTPRFLILTPTRELANQITKAISTYGKFLSFTMANLVGGMSYYSQNKELARGPNIIVATPGRLLDHIDNERVNLSQIETLVLDEADRMLDMGFLDDVKRIIKESPKKRQTLLFSATMDKQLQRVVQSIMHNPLRIDLSTQKISAPQITQEIYRTLTINDKSRLLKYFLSEVKIYKAIIFSATKINADKLANQLLNDGFSASALHGDLRQNVRNRIVEKFRQGNIQFLVATDVAARGIDISDVTHVINYDLPKFSEDYIHRIGRTGRAGKTGVAISFVTPADNRVLQRIERYVGSRFKVIHNLPINSSSPELSPYSPRDDDDEKNYHHRRQPSRHKQNHFNKSPSKRKSSFKNDSTRPYPVKVDERDAKRKKFPHWQKDKALARKTRNSDIRA